MKIVIAKQGFCIIPDYLFWRLAFVQNAGIICLPIMAHSFLWRFPTEWRHGDIDANYNYDKSQKQNDDDSSVGTLICDDIGGAIC